MSSSIHAARRALRDRVLVLAGIATFTASTPLFAQQARLDLSGLETAGNQRFIVKYRDVTGAPARTLQAASAVLGKDTRLVSLRRTADGADVIRASRRLDRVEAESLLRRMAANPAVEYVEVDALLHPAMTPDDPRYPEQWGYSGPYGIKANQAWDRATGAGVVVAVVDSGIASHSDLSANLLPGYDLISDPWVANDGDGRDADASDPGDGVEAGECDVGSPAQSSLWHGTHVAGTVAAVTGNGRGVAGVAPGGKIVPVRVLGRCGAYTSDLADGIAWASGAPVAGVPVNGHPAEVVNISLGGVATCSVTLQNAINTAVSRGTTVVVAAGNDAIDAARFTPANCGNVIAVGASTASGARAAFSNYGAAVDIAAPGSAILSTSNTGTMAPAGEGYESLSGTSMAAPHVSGVVALVQSAAAAPRTPAQVEALLKTTASPFPATPSQPIGAGIVDARAALDAVLPSPPPAITTLVNGVALTGLAGALRTERVFVLQVPAGATALKFVTQGGSGDADLYVGFGRAPTTSAYLCRSNRSGNADSCSFSVPKAGTYYVMLRAYTAFAGLSLTGSYGTVSGRRSYGNASDYAIRDLATVESPVTVSGRAGNAPSDASVSVAIRHTYRGDLKVDLVAPDGSLYNLHNRSGGSGDNLDVTLTRDLSNEPLNGTWRLRVYDASRGDTGYIDQWSITF